MASCADAANFDALVSRNTIREAIRKALRLNVGRGRRFTVKELSNGSGIPDRLIECAMCGVETEDFRPLSQEALASITKFLGASFASVYLEASGLGAFDLFEGQAPLPKVLCAAEVSEDTAEERKRLIRRLAELEGL